MIAKYFFLIALILNFNDSFGQSIKYDTLSSYLIISKCDSCVIQKVKGYVVAKKSHFIFDNMFNEDIKPKYIAIDFLDENKIKIKEKIFVLSYKLNN